MTTGFDFNEELAKRIEAVYETRDAIRRREVILGALNLKAGEKVLDIGTGPGFMALEMSKAVGPTGKIECIDLSSPMLELARRRCIDKPWVSFQTADALKLPFPTDDFDVAVSVQVFEYINDVMKALTELHRVLRPGGRAVVVSTDWDSIIWHASYKERMRRVLSAFE
jgi:ubiquinone/menaquinone biosynthesis C-methylase UbiE